MNYTPLSPGIPGSLPGPIPGRLAGIDAGGSATRVVVLADGELSALPSAPPMNAILTPDITDRILDLVGAAAPDAAGVGLPGVRTAGTAVELSEMLTKRAGIPIHVTDDGITTTLGAFGGKPGIVVHAGTGSGATGWDGADRWARAGGHGYLLGDEGSAYWLGRAAVNAALRWEDGAGGSAAIHEAVTRAADCPLADFVRKIYNHPSERMLLTPLAPVISDLAATDPAALSLAHEAAAHLAALAEALRGRLGPLPDAQRGTRAALPLCGTGGVLSAPVIWERFAELTGAVRPLAPPEVGAVLLAAGVLEDSRA
jgi:N-acetylglucosamine kinase-like BadF-type ATPase